MILAVNADAKDLQRGLAEDPFNARGYAVYSVVAVDPTRTAPGFALGR